MVKHLAHQITIIAIGATTALAINGNKWATLTAIIAFTAHEIAYYSEVRKLR